MNTQSQYLTVAQAAEKYPCFTVAGLRWQLFNRATNGFDRCVIRTGRRVRIDEAEFVAWLRDQRERKVATAT